MISLTQVYDRLFEAYGRQHWWPANSPFEMMVGAILTQNTAWTNVERAIANFGGRLSPEFILACPVEDLMAIIRPSGFFSQKAPRLKRLAQWFTSYGCDVAAVRRENPEKIRGELLALSGVGRETADSILLYAFAQPYFVVDAYTRRIFTRLGFPLPGAYDEVRFFFERALPRGGRLYNEYHALIVRHAKAHCKAKPACEGCPLKNACSAFAALDKTAGML